MPSPIAHVLAGLSIGLSGQSSPRDASNSAAKPLSRVVLLAGLLAALPDADLLYSPMHRMFTHSLAATALVMIVAAVVTGKVTGRVDWRTVLILTTAYGSHILLDWLGSDPFRPQGVKIFWPSDRFYISGWDVFPPTERRIFTNPLAFYINLKAAIAETLMMVPFVLAGWAIRRRRRSRGRTSVQDVPLQPFVSAGDRDGI